MKILGSIVAVLVLGACHKPAPGACLEVNYEAICNLPDAGIGQTQKYGDEKWCEPLSPKSCPVRMWISACSEMRTNLGQPWRLQ